MKGTNNILNEQDGPKLRPPFDVPEGYFETFEDRLEARIAAMEEPKSTKVTLLRILKPIVGLAAGFLLIMTLIKYPLSKVTSLLSNQQNTATESADWADEPFMSNISFFDDREFVQIIESDESLSPEQEDKFIDYITHELNDYEIFAELNN